MRYLGLLFVMVGTSANHDGVQTQVGLLDSGRKADPQLTDFAQLHSELSEMQQEQRRQEADEVHNTLLHALYSSEHVARPLSLAIVVCEGAREGSSQLVWQAKLAREEAALEKKGKPCTHPTTITWIYLMCPCARRHTPKQ